MTKCDRRKPGHLTTQAKRGTEGEHEMGRSISLGVESGVLSQGPQLLHSVVSEGHLHSLGPGFLICKTQALLDKLS